MSGYFSTVQAVHFGHSSSRLTTAWIFSGGALIVTLRST